MLDRYRGVRAVAARLVDPERLRTRHDPILTRVQRLVRGGQDDGLIRTDLPAGWLVTAFYSLMHAAADDAEAGRLAPDEVPGVLDRTLRSLLAPPPR